MCLFIMMQVYDWRSSALAACELACKVRMHRVWTSRFGTGALAGRATDYPTLDHGISLGFPYSCLCQELIIAS